jgi:hypothetical protein
MELTDRLNAPDNIECAEAKGDLASASLSNKVTNFSCPNTIGGSLNDQDMALGAGKGSEKAVYDCEPENSCCPRELSNKGISSRNFIVDNTGVELEIHFICNSPITTPINVVCNTPHNEISYYHHQRRLHQQHPVSYLVVSLQCSAVNGVRTAITILF